MRSSFARCAVVLCLTLAFVNDVSARTCAPPSPGLVAGWPGNGNTDDVVGARNGSLVGGVGFAPGMVGDAFSFDGSGSVEVADDPLWMLGTEDFTILLWVRFNALNGRDPLIAHDEGGGCFAKWIFWHDVQGHRAPFGPALRFLHASPGCGILAEPVVYPWQPHPGQWYHVALTRSGSDYSLYVDGARVITERDANPIADPSAPLSIGRAETFFLNGLVDEVGMFDRALSPAEIQAIHAAGSAGTCRVTRVKIDIKPDGFPNSVNPRSAGVIPVAIITTPTFDATSVVASTVRFGPSGTEAAPKHSALEDVDGDGEVDMILHFPTASAAIVCGATSAMLTGRTSGGELFTGVDSLRTVGCK
jgi:concanavalin A-like lectin/glucanase superfamily protein